jgi:hypothetical protein
VTWFDARSVSSLAARDWSRSRSMINPPNLPLQQTGRTPRAPTRAATYCTRRQASRGAPSTSGQFGALLAMLLVHAAPVHCLATVPDCSYDGAVKIRVYVDPETEEHTSTDTVSRSRSYVRCSPYPWRTDRVGKGRALASPR